MEMAASTATSLLPAVRLELEPDDKEARGFGGIRRRKPQLSLTKPSWIVRTEANVRKEIRKKPDPPCVVCHGTGRVDCPYCSGQGRTNCVHLAMLPKGEWPKWCRDCGGSGLSYCSRCLGTGEYRYIMGFHFMNMDSDDNQKPQQQQQQHEPPQTAAERLLNR